MQKSSVLATVGAIAGCIIGLALTPFVLLFFYINSDFSDDLSQRNSLYKVRK